MRPALALLTGSAIAVLAWIGTLFLWDFAAVYNLRLIGMIHGDVEAPYIVLFGGGLYAIALLLLIVGALLNGIAMGLTTYGGIGLTILAEWTFCSYLDRLRRFVSPEYDRLPPPRPVPLVDDASFHGQLSAAIALHILAVVAMTATVFFAVRWIRGQSASKIT